MENAVTHVARAPTSLVSGAFAGDLCVGSASSGSAKAMLSRSRSCFSTNSRAWILRTSLPGMGEKLDAKWNGGGTSAELECAVCLIGGADVAGRPAEDEGRVRAGPATAVVGSSGMLARDSGRGEADNADVPGGKESGQLSW